MIVAMYIKIYLFESCWFAALCTCVNYHITLSDHIFGTNTDSSITFQGVGKSSGESGSRSVDDDRLESPSKVLGGSTSWTGGLSHGCAAVFRNNEAGN